MKKRTIMILSIVAAVIMMYWTGGPVWAEATWDESSGYSEPESSYSDVPMEMQDEENMENVQEDAIEIYENETGSEVDAIENADENSVDSEDGAVYQE